MRYLVQKLPIGILSAALMLSACTDKQNENTPVQSAPVNEAKILKADSSEWLSHGRTYSEQRFSPLKSINSDNTAQLGLTWAYDLQTSRGIEVTPIVSDGIMYVTSTWNIVTALDAKTGKMLWEFDPEVDRSRAAYLCCDAVNRGVAIWEGKIFTGTIDGRLIAINAKTGEKIWDVGTIDKSMPYTITGAPRVVKGKVIIGNGGAELGVRGYVSAFDVNTGEQIWRFYTVPGNPADGFESKIMEVASKTWKGEYWTAGGGGTAWDSMAYDPDLDLLYVGVGNGSPWNQAIRSPGGGDNLFLSSIVAVRPDTGEYVWHYQTTPGETWDYTATQHMILAELEIEGHMRKVIMQAPKNGFFYVIDRETGRFISGDNFVPVNWATHIDKTTGRPVEVPEARWGGKAPYLQLPGSLGGHNWHPMSYSQDTGLVYIPAQELPWAFMDKAGYKYHNGVWNTGSDFSINGLSSDEAQFKGLKAALKGRLLAWDPVAQKPAWKVEHAGPWNGGVLSTGGNLVFQGTADAHFAAYDAKTGTRKWDFFSQTGIVAAPISYSIDGEQYVAVASGWGGSYVMGFGGVMPASSADNAGRILVFKLGGTAELPKIETVEFETPKPPANTASAETVALGANNYMNNCSSCHGANGVTSGHVPNLQLSYALGDAAEWENIVIKGALSENGMPNFNGHLSATDVDAIRAYIISEANAGHTQAVFDQIGRMDEPRK